MSANELLLWMSARKEGSWPQFRSAVAMLSTGDATGDESHTTELPLHQLLRFNLQRLGHAEFFAAGSVLRWRVAPPVLAVSKLERDWLGIAAGARHNGLAQALSSSPLRFSALPLASAPNALLVRATDANQLAEVARTAGMVVQHDAPAAILGCVPPIDAKHSQVNCAVPLGNKWRVDRFSPERLSWTASNRQEALTARGHLFKFESKYEKQYLLSSGSSHFRVAQQVGKFIVLRQHRQKVVRYDAKVACFSLPSICRPPLLVERALVLCSGRPPRYETVDGRGVVHYDDVPLSIAISAASLLRQELRA
ncbi:MAG: hypothetical protein ACREX4_01710 [Gammaproteobacteria bacterium]